VLSRSATHRQEFKVRDSYGITTANLYLFIYIEFFSSTYLECGLVLVNNILVG